MGPGGGGVVTMHFLANCEVRSFCSFLSDCFLSKRGVRVERRCCVAFLEEKTQF